MISSRKKTVKMWYVYYNFNMPFSLFTGPLHHIMQTSDFKLLNNEKMQRCIGFHDGCELTYFLDNVETDDFFSTRVKLFFNIFFTFSKLTLYL